MCKHLVIIIAHLLTYIKQNQRKTIIVLRLPRQSHLPITIIHRIKIRWIHEIVCFQRKNSWALGVTNKIIFKNTLVLLLLLKIIFRRCPKIFFKTGTKIGRTGESALISCFRDITFTIGD